MSSNLPLVGAHAVLLGVNAFQQNARSIIFQLNEVNAVVGKLGRDSERHYQAAASSAQRHANVVTAQAARAITAYANTGKAAQDAARAEAAANQAAFAALAAHSAAVVKHVAAQAEVVRATNDVANAQSRLNALITAGASAKQVGFAQGAITVAQRNLSSVIADEEKLREAVLRTNLARQVAAQRATALMNVYAKEKAAQQDLKTATDGYVRAHLTADTAINKHKVSVEAAARALVTLKVAQKEAADAIKAAAAIQLPVNPATLPPSSRTPQAQSAFDAASAARVGAQGRVAASGAALAVAQKEASAAVQAAQAAAQAREEAEESVTKAVAREAAARVALFQAEHNVTVANAQRAAAQQAAAYAIITAGAAQFNAVLRSVVATLAQFIAASQQAAVVVTASLGVALATVVGIGIGATKTAATYEEALTRIQAVTEAPRAQMEALDASIEKIGTTTRVSMREAAEASEELAKGGLNVAEQLGSNALTAVTNLAQASRGELSPAAAATAIAVGKVAFNMQDATKIADAMTATVQSSAITFSDLKIALQQAALTAGNLNYTLPETVAAIGLLGEVGLRGSDAGTSLRTALQHLEKPSKKAREVMNEFGLSLYDAAGNARPLRDVISNLEQSFGKDAVAAGKASEAQRNWALQTIFGTDGARAMIALIGQGTAKFDEFTAAQSRLTAQDLANKYMLPLNAQFDLLSGNIQRVATRIGQGLIPVIGPLIGQFTQLLASIPTQALYLFGQAVSALANNTGFGELNAKITELFGEGTAATAGAVRVQQFVALLRSIATAVRTNVLPALAELGAAITKPFNEAGSLTRFIDVTRAIAQGFNTVTIVVGGVARAIANLITTLRSNQTAAANVITTLKGLVAIPIIGLVAIFGGVAIAIAKVAAVAFLVGTAVNNWDKLKPMIAGLADFISGNLTTAITVATIAAGLFLAALSVAKITAFITSIVAVIATIGTLSKVLASSTGAALSWAVVHAKAAGTVAIAYATMALNSLKSLGLMITAGVVWSASAVRNAGIVIVMYGTQLPKAIATGAVVVRTQLALMSASFVATAKAATLAAAAIIRTWIAGIGPVIAAVATAIVANIVPVLIAIAAIAGAAFALYKAWEKNFLGVQDITRGVLAFVGNLLGEFFKQLKESPLGEFITGLIDPFSQFSQGAQASLGIVDDSVNEIKQSIKDLEATLAGSRVTNTPGGQTAALIGTGPATPQMPDMSGALVDVQAWLDQLEALNAELGRTTQQQAETAAGANDFGDAGEDAARRYKAALKSLNELFEDTQRKLENIAEDTAEKIAAAQQKHQDSWVEAHEEAVKEITQVYENAAEQIEDMWADLNFSRGQRAQKESLQETIDDARRAREQAREDADKIEDRRVDSVRRARQEETEEVERALSEQIELEDRALNRGTQLMERAQQKRNDIAQRALSDRQDAEQRALADQFDAANRARSAGRDESRAQRSNERDRAKLQADFSRDIAKAKTEEERQQIAERFNERVSELNQQQALEAQDRAQRRAEEEADAAERKKQEEAQRALRKKQEAEERALKESQDDADLARRFQQEDADFARRKANDKKLRDFRKEADKTERLEREKEDDAAIARRRKLDEDERLRRNEEDKEIRALEDRLEEEALNRRATAINKEAEKRVAAINAALTEKQAAIDKQLKDELIAIERNLKDQLRALRQQWIDKIPEILEQGGEAIRPEIERLANTFITNLNAVDTALQTLIDDLKEAVSLQAEVASATSDADEGPHVNTPSNTPGAPSFSKGGVIPGPFGKPIMIRAHGGEIMLGLHASRALMTAENRAASITSSMVNAPNTTYHTEYNVDAHYQNYQSPASVEMDLRAIQAMLGR